MDTYRARFSELIPHDKTAIPITIVGAGAVGSWTCLALTKMGFSNIRIYDFDTITDENIGVQFFPIKDIGKLKVESLQTLCQEFSGIPIARCIPSAADETTDYYGEIVIMAVDSMTVRKQIFDGCVKTGAKLIIDSRMGAEYANIYTRKTLEATSYYKSWYPDSEANSERCTAKATTYTASLISGFICKIVKDFINNNKYARTINFNIRDNAIQILS